MGCVVEQLSGGRAPTRVLCCGHSLGGALATLGQSSLLSSLTNYSPSCEASAVVFVMQRILARDLVRFCAQNCDKAELCVVSSGEMKKTVSLLASV